MTIDLSIVVPVYGCAAILPELHRRLTAALAEMGKSYEIILVDDRAPDRAWPVIQGLARQDPRVVGLRLARNVGQHKAITAGLAHAKGAAAVVMDCDLQDPPEAIPALMAEAARGHPIVYAKRKGQKRALSTRLINWLYFEFLFRVSGRRIDPELGTFSLITRPVIDAYLAFRERDRHYLFILYWLGFDHATIEFGREGRREGRSSYTFAARVAHAIQGIFFQTTVFLRWVMYLGLFTAAAGFALAGWMLVNFYLSRHVPEGWTSLIVVQLIMSGAVIGSIGVVGLYIARIFDEVRQRPLYIVEETTAPPAER